MPEIIAALMPVRCRHCAQSLHAEAEAEVDSQDPKGAKGYHFNTDQGRAFTAGS